MAWYLIGLSITFVFASYEVLVNLTSMPNIKDVITVGLTNESISNNFLGWYRVKSTFFEPSHYAIYLVISYALLENLHKRKVLRIRWHLWKILIILFLLSTLSVTGFLLLSVYYLYSFVRNLSTKIVYRNVARNILYLTVIVITVYLMYEDISKLGGYFWRRLEAAYVALQKGIYVGSEAVRAQSILMFWEYLQSAGLRGAVIGEGYANYEEWLVNNYGHLRSSFAKGGINSLPSTLIISIGIPGLVIFFVYFLSITRLRANKVPMKITLVMVAVYFVRAYILGLITWMPILISLALFTKNENI